MNEICEETDKDQTMVLDTVMHQKEPRAQCTSISTDPPQNITDQPPNWSGWRMRQKAKCSPQRLQTRSRLPMVNLPLLVLESKCQLAAWGLSVGLWLTALWVFLLALMSRERPCCSVVALLQPPLLLLVYWPASWYLLHTLHTETQGTVWPWHIWMCHH